MSQGPPSVTAPHLCRATGRGWESLVSRAQPLSQRRAGARGAGPAVTVTVTRPRGAAPRECPQEHGRGTSGFSLKEEARIGHECFQPACYFCFSPEIALCR